MAEELRLRTINGAYDEIKRNDPGTAITRDFLRQAVTIGRIPSVRTGRKYLIDLNDVYAYLRTERERSRREYQDMIEKNRGKYGV